MNLNSKSSSDSTDLSLPWFKPCSVADGRRRGRLRGSLAACLAAVCLWASLAASDLATLGVQRYTIDPFRSYVTFTIGFMKIKSADGTFHDYTGTILFDPEDVTRSTVSSVIRVESVFTGVRPRDRHLRSSDFFDAEKYPVILFRSTALKRNGSALELSGDLTMHGNTHRITIPITLFERMKDDSGRQRLHCQGAVTLRRRDFGIIGNFWGDKVLSDEVRIDLNIEAEPLAVPESEMARMKGLQSIQDLLTKALDEGGAAAATRLYHSIRMGDSSRYDLGEGELLRLAESLSQQGRQSEALAMVRLNLEVFPKHELSWDRLGTLLAESGDLEGALAAYRELLRLNPYSTIALEMLRWLKGPQRAAS